MNVKKMCAHCFTEREVKLMWRDDDGSWLCRSVVECLESYANLPGWLRV